VLPTLDQYVEHPHHHHHQYQGAAVEELRHHHHQQQQQQQQHQQQQDLSQQQHENVQPVRYLEQEVILLWNVVEYICSIFSCGSDAHLRGFNIPVKEVQF
jgi:hypothetical protein